jgi:quercetin dioxygenase-like cupin family protein
MTTSSLQDTSRVPFRGTQPAAMRPDLVVPDAFTADPRLWVPLEEGVSLRPLQFNVTQGQYTHFLRVTASGIISRHRHGGPVHAYVMRGRWHYLEHDWVAEEGSYVFEPPGETHTLVVPEGADEMITLFQVNGPLIYVDPDGNACGYDDVFTRLAAARAHYRALGLEHEIDALIR